MAHTAPHPLPRIIQRGRTFYTNFRINDSKKNVRFSPSTDSAAISLIVATHTMRNAPARIMWNDGVPPGIISNRLGHNSTGVTVRYPDITKDQLPRVNAENLTKWGIRHHQQNRA